MAKTSSSTQEESFTQPQCSCEIESLCYNPPKKSSSCIRESQEGTRARCSEAQRCTRKKETTQEEEDRQEGEKRVVQISSCIKKIFRQPNIPKINLLFKKKKKKKKKKKS